MKFIFRADASLTIGSGHVMRCRTLARELQRRGAAVTFLCRRQPGDLISLLEQEFPVLALPDQSLAPCEGLEGRELYGAWLGCSQTTDAAQCLEALGQGGITSASWRVADHYGLDAHWEALLLTGLASGAATPTVDAQVQASVALAFMVGRLQRFARSGFKRLPSEHLEASLAAILG